MDQIELKRIVDEQAEDEELWFFSETASEAYLQAKLRYLHAVVEEYLQDEVVLEMQIENLKKDFEMRLAKVSLTDKPDQLDSLQDKGE